MKKLPQILAFGIFGIMCFFAFWAPEKPLEAEVIVHKTEIKRNTYPAKISIESIGVNAPIESVGILDGAMAVPTFGHNVGWYSLGTKPGEPGSAVLAGHVNWKHGEDAVFTNLKNIHLGDTVTITNNYGQKTFFKVVDIKSVSLYEDTTEIFSSADGISKLNLITCDGTWNDLLNTHDSRLVVFTERVY